MGWVIGIAVLGVGGFIAYKVYSTSSNPLGNVVSTVETTAGSAVSTAENILNKDPISVTSVAKDVYGGAKSVVHGIENLL